MGNLRTHLVRLRPRLLVMSCAIAILLAGCGGDDGIVGARWDVGSAGSRAADFLGATDYTSLIVEIQPFEGMQPTQQTIDNLTQFLQTRLNKPGGIQVVVDSQLPASGQTQYSIEQIRHIETQSRKRYSSGKTMAAYFLMLDGDSDQSSGNTRILGHAYGATSMAIYEVAIEELSGGIGEPTRDVLESTVIEHEFGHILGLVDNGSAAVDPAHHDQGNGAHCANQSCLMHYSVDLSDVVANLLGGVPALDADCINDLRGNGGQ